MHSRNFLEDTPTLQQGATNNGLCSNAPLNPCPQNPCLALFTNTIIPRRLPSPNQAPTLKDPP